MLSILRQIYYDFFYFSEKDNLIRNFIIIDFLYFNVYFYIYNAYGATGYLKLLIENLTILRYAHFILKKVLMAFRFV